MGRGADSAFCWNGGDCAATACPCDGVHVSRLWAELCHMVSRGTVIGRESGTVIDAHRVSRSSASCMWYFVL